jgi:hypothetical protein
MKNVKTGGVLAAQADRSCNPSRNGNPTATEPAPDRKARRLNLGVRPSRAVVFDSVLDLTLMGDLQRRGS